MVCRQDKFIYNKHSDMRWKNILPHVKCGWLVRRNKEEELYTVTAGKCSSHILAKEKEDLVYKTHQFACTNKNMLKTIRKTLLVA